MPRTLGESTPMPSLKLTLPAHVTARPRADGTFRVLFEVRRGRPRDWPSTIPLPRSSRRTGDLTNADEVARIFADAEALTLELERARQPAAGPPPGSLPAVALAWKASDWWADLRPRTRNFYTKSLWPLEDWSASLGHPPLSSMALPRILAFLRLYADRPAQQSNLKRTLSALFSFAREAGMIAVHPFGAPVRVRRKVRGRQTPVGLWSASSVEAYGRAAVALGWAAGKRMIRLMWETSADASDVITWRRDQHFRDGPCPAIIFERGKTGQRGAIPISLELAADLRSCGQLYLVTNPDGRPYAADDVTDDNRRGRDFARVREAAVAAGADHLLLDHLRHSAATDAMESGASLEATSKLTLHRDKKTLEQVYWQMTESQALAVQRARGIVS